MRLTIDGEESRFTDATASNIFCNATVIAHVGKSGLSNEEMTICGQDVVWIPLWVDDPSIS